MKKLVLALTFLSQVALAQDNNIVSGVVGDGPTGSIQTLSSKSSHAQKDAVIGLMYQRRIDSSPVLIGVLFQNNQTTSAVLSVSF